MFNLVLPYLIKITWTTHVSGFQKLVLQPFWCTYENSSSVFFLKTGCETKQNKTTTKQQQTQKYSNTKKLTATK